MPGCAAEDIAEQIQMQEALHRRRSLSRSSPRKRLVKALAWDLLPCMTPHASGAGDVRAACLSLPYANGVSPRRKELCMELIKVDSSMIDAVGYDEQQHILEVVFRRSGVYRYRDVP